MAFSLIILVLVLCIPLLIGIYVWRDAADRGMNAPLWTLVAVLAPTFIGLIIYLLVRSSYSNLKCPKCGTRVQERFAVCPTCGAKLKATCDSCGYPAEQGWKVCPHCAAPLNLSTAEVTPPVQKKDKLLGKIILAIVVIPLALLVIFMLGLTFMRTSNGYGITSSTVSIEDAAQVDKVGRWMYQCRSDAQTAFDATQEVTQTYALRYRTGETGVNYLFYLPYVDCDSNSCETEIVPSFRGDVLAVKASGASNSDGMLYAVNIEGTQPGQVRVKLDGKKTTCNIQDVDYDPCAFAIVDEEDDDDRWLSAAATEQQGATDPQIKRWLAQCRREKLSDKQIKVYALRYRGEDLTGYLFYFRNLANPKDGEDSPDIEEVLDGDLTVTANGDADSKTGGILYAVRILDGSVPDQVKVELNGKTVQCDVQEAKFDPCQPIFDLEDDGFDAEDADADDVDTDEADKGADNADTAAKSA